MTNSDAGTLLQRGENVPSVPLQYGTFTGTFNGTSGTFSNLRYVPETGQKTLPVRGVLSRLREPGHFRVSRCIPHRERQRAEMAGVGT